MATEEWKAKKTSTRRRQKKKIASLQCNATVLPLWRRHTEVSRLSLQIQPPKNCQLGFCSQFWRTKKKEYTNNSVNPTCKTHSGRRWVLVLVLVKSRRGLEESLVLFTWRCDWKKTTLPPDVSLIIVHMFNEITEVWGVGGGEQGAQKAWTDRTIGLKQRATHRQLL